MDTSHTLCSWILLFLVLAAAMTGCGAPAGPQLQWWSTHRHDQVDEGLAEHRSRFQQEGDADALRWLLANRIASGMSLFEVAEVLGSKGERVWNDHQFKVGAGRYQETDETYKWGPDSSGSSVYLVFRDGNLVNYDPRQYRQSANETDRV